MKKLLIIISATAVAVAGVAVAHPLLGPYDTLGDCQRDFVDFDKAERLRLLDEDTTQGDTQSEIRDKFLCLFQTGDTAPYDNGPGWYITNIQ